MAFEECSSGILDRGIPIIDLEDRLDEFGARRSVAMFVPPGQRQHAGAIGGRSAAGLIDRPKEGAEVRVLSRGRECLVVVLGNAHRGRMPYRLGIRRPS